ncbi:hypothetical protein Q5P01_011655 [Channa striata]|uniref:Uncharacterized protein n=1 Tax=Channa striata TaxID=64152 RepID=A0AA88MU13_CHASR|nr:hypothetical protein Q5P01_011655 [Channa striata]
MAPHSTTTVGCHSSILKRKQQISSRLLRAEHWGDSAADQGDRGRRQSPGMSKPPVLRHPFAVHQHTPIPPPPPRWMTLQPAWVSCAEGAPCTPAPSLEPQRKSAAVHRGNPALPGVPAQPGTICPRPLTQKQHRQGGFPLTCCTLRVMWARPGTEDRSITTGVCT